MTALLQKFSAGDRSAFDNLLPLVYQELHRIADAYFVRESPGHTLQPTALIHEAYLRIVEQSHPAYANRSHFYGVAARVMRQILVDHARSRSALKRAPNGRVPISEVLDSYATEDSDDIVALDEALQRLTAFDATKASLVEMRFFAGMTVNEISEFAKIPVGNVRRELRLAQAWLHKEMQP